MNEKALHWIWEKQRFESPDLRLTSGETLTILSPGNYNKDRSGPDFELGRIKIGNVEFCGPIEIHVKSSDWIKHGHQNDPAYNNVILHVVAEHDLEIVVNGYQLPTLVLSHFAQFNSSAAQNSSVLCSSFINEMEPVYLESMKSKALNQKLNLKIQRFINGACTKEEVFYFLLASAFGMKINQKPFEELAARAPWEELASISSTAKFQLILVRSGLLHEDRKKVTIGGYAWNYKGTRPGNYPSRRVGQFATLIAGGIVEEFIQLRANYLENFTQSTDRYKMEDGTPLFSVTFRNHLVVNAVVPYLYWESRFDDNLSIVENILSQLPIEKNIKVNQWKKVGVSMKNAYDSQSFLALDRYYCNRKKCLSCEVGNKVLNR